jgi:hypothetical protein
VAALRRVALGIVFLSSLLACPPREVLPEEVGASIVRFGEYRIEGGQSEHARETSEIQCELGRLFGVDYRIEYPEGASGPIPVSLRWVHPMIEIPRLAVRGTESPGGTASPTARRGSSQVEGRSLWSFEHPEELVPGRYEFQIRLRDDARVLASHAFEVVDC